MEKLVIILGTIYFAMVFSGLAAISYIAYHFIAMIW